MRMNLPAIKSQPRTETYSHSISLRSHAGGKCLTIFSPMLALLLAFLTAFTARAEEAAPGKPLLWRIGSEKPSYVFGTIHLAGPRETKIAPMTEKALNGCDALLCEIPMDMVSQLKAATGMMNSNQSLKAKLPKDLYDGAEAELKLINPALSLEPFDHLQTWAIMIILPLIEEQMKRPDGKPLDAQLYARAEAAGKKVGGIETIEEQLAVFSDFTADEQNAMLRSTLDDMRKGRREKVSPIEQLREAYLTGDLATLDAKITEWMKDLDPALLKHVLAALITKRNHVMADRMAEKVKNGGGKSFFFAIGAGHLGGDEGVLKLLEKAGLKVERVVE